MSLEIHDISKAARLSRPRWRPPDHRDRQPRWYRCAGAGKSTLFSVVSGFARADEGQIRPDGQSLDSLSPPARARAGMVRTFQVPREFRHLTVRENLMAAAPKQTGESLLGLFFVGPGA